MVKHASKWLKNLVLSFSLKYLSYLALKNKCDLMPLSAQEKSTIIQASKYYSCKSLLATK